MKLLMYPIYILLSALPELELHRLQVPLNI